MTRACFHPLALLLAGTLPLWVQFSPAQAQQRPFPYTLTRADWGIAGAGLTSTAVGFYLTDRADPITLAQITALDAGGVMGFDRGATHNWSPTWQDRSDWGKNILLAGSGLLAMAPPILGGDLAEAFTVGTLFAETFSLVLGTTYVTKSLVGRTRPYAYNTALTPEERLAIAGPDDPDVRFSFFSGHASAAFAAATLVSTIYGDLHGPTTTSRVVWATSLSVASYTAYARVKGGVHFTTDVIAGAAVGTAIGYLVPALHRGEGSRAIGVAGGPDGIRLSIPVGGR